MKKILFLFLTFIFSITLVSCGCKGCKAIELMGAGDRIHNSFTFANVGVNLKETSETTYEISGSVEKLDSEAVKKEFSIDDNITHVVAIKLTAIDTEVDSKNVVISVDGNEAFDAEHLNGSDYTFIILEAVKGKTVSITVSWNGVDEYNYVLLF